LTTCNNQADQKDLFHFIQKLKHVIMTKRDFFSMLVRLFGLYLLFMTFLQLPPQFIYLYNTNIGEKAPIWIMMGEILIAIIMLAYLIGKSDFVVNLIKLDKGFDDPVIQLGALDTSKLINLGVIIVAGSTILSNVSGVLVDGYLLIKAKNNHDPLGIDYQSSWFIQVINVILGWLLLTSRNRVVSWLANKTNGTANPIQDRRPVD